METIEHQLDPETGTKLFRQLLDEFIIPEIKRRHSAGTVETPVELIAAQIVFFPDERKPQIRINDEVRALAKAKAKPGILKKKGEAVFEHELDYLREFALTNQDNPDCAHITLIRLGPHWTIGFDFAYNRTLTHSHLKSAAEFLESARLSLAQGLLAPCIDSLFSSVELCAKAILLSLPDAHFREKASHSSIHRKFNRYAELGNIAREYRQTFNRLSALRDQARYHKTELRIGQDEALKLLDTVSRFLQEANKRKPTFRIQAEKPMGKGELVRWTENPFR